jgi:lipopolysaccharide/colanic/teichoic acid biosynthesis glycosyltransferase
MSAGVEAHGVSQAALLGAESRAQRLPWLAWRVVDVTVAALLLVALLPLLIVVAVVIKLDSSGPVVFRQWRVGIGMREFSVRKFRTMRQDAESVPHRAYIARLIDGGERGDAGRAKPLYKLGHDDRITGVGGFLRRWSIDELPQLWNVLRGEMSLVGPRPAIPYELDHYEPHWFERFSVKPGLTGLWQVSGRSRLDFRDMVRLDLEYVESRSLWLNIRILARTARAVVDGKGAA